MSRIYKVCIHGHPKVGTMEIFAIKPYLESFDNLKEEIFIRKPDLKNRDIRIYYTDADDDRVTISNALDYAIFKESGFNRVFVAVTNDEVVQQPIASPSPPVATPRAEVSPPVERKRVSMPMELDLPAFVGVELRNPFHPSILKNVQPQSASAPSTPSAPNKVLHPGVVCDGCDIDIIGFRYKCMDCVDFDLCMDCESKMMHHEHVMLRISRPNDVDLGKLKLRKRLGRHRHSEGWTKIDERPTEPPKRAHRGHHHHEHTGHAKRRSLPQQSTMTPYELLNSIFNNQCAAQSPATNTTQQQQQQQSTQSTQVDASLNQDKNDAQSKATNAGAGPSPTNAQRAPQTNPIAACIQNIPEFIRLGITKAQAQAQAQAQSGKCPMQGQYKNGFDALADLANNFAVMMDPFAASFDMHPSSHSAPTPAPSKDTATPAPAPAPAQAAAAAVEKAVPVAPVVVESLPESKAAEATAAPAATNAAAAIAVVPPVVAAAVEPNRIAAESILIEDVEDDEDELMRDLLKKMTTFNAGAEKKNTPEASEQPSAATSIEVDGKTSPAKGWTLLDADDTECNVAVLPSTSQNTGTIPKRSPHVIEATAQAEAALKQSEIASSAAYAAVQAATDAQEKAERIEYAELSRLLGDHIKQSAPSNGGAAKQPEPAPVSRTESVVPMEETAASAPPPALSAADKRVQEALAAMITMGFSNEGGWLTQLLEAVDGNIPRALDLLQPHK